MRLSRDAEAPADVVRLGRAIGVAIYRQRNGKSHSLLHVRPKPTSSDAMNDQTRALEFSSGRAGDRRREPEMLPGPSAESTTHDGASGVTKASCESSR